MTDFINSLKPNTKAIVAFVVGCLQVLALYVSLNSDGSISSADLEAIINAIILALTGTGAVWYLPNKKAR